MWWSEKTTANVVKLLDAVENNQGVIARWNLGGKNYCGLVSTSGCDRTGRAFLTIAEPFVRAGDGWNPAGDGVYVDFSLLEASASDAVSDDESETHYVVETGKGPMYFICPHLN